jgi:hypothetical protein
MLPLVQLLSHPSVLAQNPGYLPEYLLSVCVSLRSLFEAVLRPHISGL